MTDRPGVSIVINNYNYGRFVGEAIDSALAQTHPLVEVIVVDDGSTDDSRAVIESYGDRIVAIFQANAGQVPACAAGFARSRYPIVVFLDSDDRLVPEAAARAAADWPATVSKKQFGMRTLNAAGELVDHVWPKYSVDMRPATVRAELLRSGFYQCPNTSGNAYAHAFLEAVSPFEDFPSIDGLLNSLAPLYGDVVTEDWVFAHYRVHGGNRFAVDAVDVDRLAAYVADDDRRLALVERHCARVGIPFAGRRVLQNLLGYCELQVIVARLRAATLADRLHVLRLVGTALRAGGQHPQAMSHRLLRAAWIVGIGVLPRPVAEALVRLRYVPSVRPRVLDLLIDLFGRHAVQR